MLREYQKECVQAVIAELKKQPSTCFSIPTGTGKTVTALHIALHFPRVLFVVHRDFLCDQFSEEAMNLLDYSLVPISGKMSPRNAPTEQSVVATIQWLCAKSGRNQESLGAFDLVIIDEAHHAIASSYKQVIESARKSNPQCKVVGMTATLHRADKRFLKEVFDSLAYFQPIAYFAKRGYLSDVKAFAFECNINLDNVSISKKTGDFVEGKVLVSAIESSDWLGVTVSAYEKYAPSKRAIAFCYDILRSKMLCDAFNAKGIPAAHIDQSTSYSERQAIISHFTSGEIFVICNVGILTEGFNVPAAECAIMARPTKSQLYYQQCVGRVLRPSPDKEYAIVLDMTDAGYSLTQFGSIDPLYLSPLQRGNLSFDGFGHEFLDTYLQSLSRRQGLVHFGVAQDTYAKLINLMNGSRIAWRAIGERAIISLSGGALLLLPPSDDQEGKYTLLFRDASTNEISPLFSESVNLDVAMEEAMEIAERYAGFLSDASAAWRSLPATPKQLNLLTTILAVPDDMVDGITRGDAAMLIEYVGFCQHAKIPIGYGIDERQLEMRAARKQPQLNQQGVEFLQTIRDTGNFPPLVKVCDTSPSWLEKFLVCAIEMDTLNNFYQGFIRSIAGSLANGKADLSPKQIGVIEKMHVFVLSKGD